MIRRTREKTLCLCNNVDQWPGPSPTSSSSLPSPPRSCCSPYTHDTTTVTFTPPHQNILTRNNCFAFVSLSMLTVPSFLYSYILLSTPCGQPPWCPPPSCCPPTSPPCCPPHPWITSIPFAAIGSKQTTTYGTKKGYFFANDCVDQNTTFFFSSSFPSSLVMAINLNKLAVWTSYNAWFWSKGKKTTLSLSFILFIQNGWTDLFPLCDWSMI